MEPEPPARVPSQLCVDGAGARHVPHRVEGDLPPGSEAAVDHVRAVREHDPKALQALVAVGQIGEAAADLGANEKFKAALAIFTELGMAREREAVQKLLAE